MSLKRKAGKYLRKYLPVKWYKILANGMLIVPGYYHQILHDAEKYAGYAAADSVEKDMLLLRKYAHIIDKGLHREDVGPGHSKNYYTLLKELLLKLSGTSYTSDPTYVWAQEKIASYEKLQRDRDSFVPLRATEEPTAISYEDLFELIRQRRSNRFFQSRTLPIEVIGKLKVTVNWAANSCNKQPIRIFETHDPSMAAKCLTCCKGGTGFSDFIPSFWVFTADSRGYVWPSEMFLPMIDVSLGSQNLFLAARTLGITGTILSWAQKDDAEEQLLRTLLQIPEEHIIVFCAVLGYASHNYIPPKRKNVE